VSATEFNPGEAGEAGEAVPDWAASYARAALYGLYSITLGSGFALGSGGAKNGALKLLTAFAVGWAITFYCALDARVHRKVFVRTFWYVTFLLWPIAPLFHLLRTRGKRGALVYALHALLLVFCITTSKAIGSLVK
jgi:hypothetical protein